MKNFTFIRTTLLFVMILSTFSALGQNAWINEIHYDNENTDLEEFIEVIIENASNYTLSDFTVTLYNGNDSTSYKTTTLGAFTEGNSYGNFTIFYYNYTDNSSSIQNGSSDGMALDYQGSLIQFLSYEGSLEAKEGVAIGVNSTDIGVSETSVTTGYSLQLAGTLGSKYSDFTWQEAATATIGTINNGQTLDTSSGITDATNKKISIKAVKGNIEFTTNGGETIEVFNALGQTVISATAKPGTNTISVNTKGLVIVKIGKQLTKVVL